MRTGVLRDAGGITIDAYMLHPRLALSRNNEATRQQQVACLLEHGIRFAGKQRFVTLEAALDHQGIRTNLIAGG